MQTMMTTPSADSPLDRLARMLSDALQRLSTSPATEPLFIVDGQTYTKAEMLSANQHDEDVCEWVRLARPGDDFPAFIECRCV